MGNVRKPQKRIFLLPKYGFSKSLTRVTPLHEFFKHFFVEDGNPFKNLKPRMVLVLFFGQRPICAAAYIAVKRGSICMTLRNQENHEDNREKNR